jgi:Mg-chelatase subunit ChlD
VRWEIYIPMVAREAPCAAAPYVDLTLVLDMSTSMLEPVPDGGRKVDAVGRAAAHLLDGLRLAPREGPADRAAVVGFNREAWIQQPMTADRAALDAALAALPGRMEEHTRLDLALEVGHAAALADPRPEADPVMVLLTDGLPNQVPIDPVAGNMETTVLRAAEGAKAAGVLIYTVGFGRGDGPDPTLYPALMRAVASRSDLYLEAPDAEALEAVAARLRRVIGCGGRWTWPLAP